MASAAILAGGRARRFDGRDKSALIVGGRTILERQLEALAAAREDVLILLAGDMPCVTSALLEYLVANDAGVDAVVPRTDRGYHPLCAVYTRAGQATVFTRLAGGLLAMTGLVEAVRTPMIGPQDVERFGPARRLLANVNTPGEFDELEALLGHKL